MLLIRDRQIQAFRAAGRERLERDLAGHLIEFFPKHTEFLGEKQLRKVVQHGVMSARNHEFRTDYETFLYVDLMFMLGGEFDRDPQLPWVSGFLEPRNGHPLGRIEGLHDRAMEYFDAVAGIDNEHWVRALVRARNFNLPSVETAAASAWAEEIERTLEKLYPEKFRYQGDAVRRFIEAEIAAAAEHGMARFSDVLSYAAHAFFAGVGFARDPLFPWTAILADASQGDAGARMSMVRAGTLDFLNFALAV